MASKDRRPPAMQRFIKIVQEGFREGSNDEQTYRAFEALEALLESEDEGMFDEVEERLKRGDASLYEDWRIATQMVAFRRDLMGVKGGSYEGALFLLPVMVQLERQRGAKKAKKPRYLEISVHGKLREAACESGILIGSQDNLSFLTKLYTWGDVRAMNPILRYNLLRDLFRTNTVPWHLFGPHQGAQEGYELYFIVGIGQFLQTRPASLLAQLILPATFGDEPSAFPELEELDETFSLEDQAKFKTFENLVREGLPSWLGPMAGWDLHVPKVFECYRFWDESLLEAKYDEYMFRWERMMEESKGIANAQIYFHETDHGRGFRLELRDEKRQRDTFEIEALWEEEENFVDLMNYFFSDLKINDFELHSQKNENGLKYVRSYAVSVEPVYRKRHLELWKH